MREMPVKKIANGSCRCGSPFRPRVTSFTPGVMGARLRATRSRFFLLAFFFIGLTLLPGCGQKKDEVIPVSTSSGGTVNVEVDPATAGTLRGKVLFEGEAPARAEISVRGNPECSALHKDGKIISEDVIVNDGALQNVFVYVKEGLENYKFDAPENPAEIDNKNCMYAPHVSGAQVGQPVIFLNSDQTLHNVHAYAKNNKSWNMGLPFQGIKQTKKFTSEEIMVNLKCDVHPWMSGYLGILPHPYFAVSGGDGSFEIKNLPPGNYVIEAWHEKLGVQTQTLTIKSKESKETTITFRGTFRGHNT